jgi:hypothetical protein
VFVLEKSLAVADGGIVCIREIISGAIFLPSSTDDGRCAELFTSQSYSSLLIVS